MSAAGTLDRLWDAFRKLVAVELQPMRWNGTYEYTITSTNGVTVDLAPTDTELGLPGLTGVQLRADAIATQVPTRGKAAHVVFLGGKLSRPVCVWTEPAGVSASLVGGGQPVARQGDFVSSNVGPGFVLTGVIAGASPGAITSGAPVAITVTLPSPIPASGTIITGRQQVKA